MADNDSLSSAQKSTSGIGLPKQWQAGRDRGPPPPMRTFVGGLDRVHEKKHQEIPLVHWSVSRLQMGRVILSCRWLWLSFSAHSLSLEKRLTGGTSLGVLHIYIR